jgi:hypothetical protein
VERVVDLLCLRPSPAKIAMPPKRAANLEPDLLHRGDRVFCWKNRNLIIYAAVID